MSGDYIYEFILKWDQKPMSGVGAKLPHQEGQK
jgi:hypothetical protein